MIKYDFIEWDEVAHHHQEDEGIDLGNEIATEIGEEDAHERGGEGILRKNKLYISLISVSCISSISFLCFNV